MEESVKNALIGETEEIDWLWEINSVFDRLGGLRVLLVT